MKKIAILLTILVVFLSGCTSDQPQSQSSNETPTRQEVQDTSTTETNKEESKNTTKSEPKTALCTNSPTPSAIGRNVYPIDQKYSHLPFLGQFFTAHNCGPERVKEIHGVESNNYTLGSVIWLKSNPSQPLMDTFKSLGFKCAENGTEANCKKWELGNTIKIDDLMKLEPYHKEFEGDDCKNCG